MSLPLIAVQHKTTVDVDLVQAVKSVIATVYQENPANYSEECANLNRCRQDALRGSAGSDLTARDLLLKYFGQLELLELRFPDLRVPFPWNDAFTGKQISQLSLAYEKASVIFNIAATLSSLAAAQSRSSNEGLKRSFNFFKQSCGLFIYINENFLHAPSTDLSREVVKTLVELMHAQATEVFIERMNVENKSANLKARVCSQASHLYHSIIEDAKDFVSKGWFARSWLLLIQCKAAYFASQAQYNKSIQDNTAGKYGDAIARLNIALESAKEASRLCAGFSSVFAPGLVPTLPSDSVSVLLELTKTQHTLISNSLTNAKRENDLIYHASPTSEASLPAIEKTAVSEPAITIQELYAAPEVQKTVGQDLFIKLVPLSVTESSSMYSEEKAKLVRAQSEAVEVADGELNTALEHLGLPASLIKFKQATSSMSGSSASAMNRFLDPGPQLVSCSQQIAASETSSSAIPSMLKSLKETRAHCSLILDSIQKELDSEERECESTRRQYADSGFDQAPASSLLEFKSFRQDLKSKREALQSAANSDDTIFSTWESCHRDIDILRDRSRLEDYFTQELLSGGTAKEDLLGDLDSIAVDEGQDQDVAKHVANIENLVDQLKRMKQERVDVLKDLKEKTHADDISHLLILNRKSQNIEPALFATELEKFRGHQSRISSTINHEASTLQELFKEWKALTEDSIKGREIEHKFSKGERKRKDLSERMLKAFTAFGEVKGGVAKGCQFYRELQELSQTLQRDVSSFIARRRQERSTQISSAQLSSKVDTSLNLNDDLSFLSSSARSPPPVSTSSPYPNTPMRPPSISSPVSPGHAPPRPFYPPPVTAQQPYMLPATTQSQTAYRPAPLPPGGAQYLQSGISLQQAQSGIPRNVHHSSSVTPTAPSQYAQSMYSGANQQSTFAYGSPYQSSLPSGNSATNYQQQQSTYQLPPPPTQLSYSYQTMPGQFSQATTSNQYVQTNAPSVYTQQRPIQSQPGYGQPLQGQTRQNQSTNAQFYQNPNGQQQQWSY